MAHFFEPDPSHTFLLPSLPQPSSIRFANVFLPVTSPGARTPRGGGGREGRRCARPGAARGDRLPHHLTRWFYEFQPASPFRALLGKGGRFGPNSNNSDIWCFPEDSIHIMRPFHNLLLFGNHRLPEFNPVCLTEFSRLLKTLRGIPEVFLTTLPHEVAPGGLSEVGLGRRHWGRDS